MLCNLFTYDYSWKYGIIKQECSITVSNRKLKAAERNSSILSKRKKIRAMGLNEWFWFAKYKPYFRLKISQHVPREFQILGPIDLPCKMSVGFR